MIGKLNEPHSGTTVSADFADYQRAQAEVVGAAFVVGLPDLGGAARIEALGVPVTTLVDFAGE